VSQSLGPEFKPQYQKTPKNQNSKIYMEAQKIPNSPNNLNNTTKKQCFQLLQYLISNYTTEAQ
jgi:hypothetical protein